VKTENILIALLQFTVANQQAKEETPVRATLLYTADTASAHQTRTGLVEDRMRD
jgi:hypothetical protein